MKINWETFATFLLALIVYRILDKTILVKIDGMLNLEDWEQE